MKRRVMALTFVVVAMISGSALAQSLAGAIGIYADQMGSSCVINTPQYTPTTFYVLARPNTAVTNGGIKGAEFRITGLPSSGLLLSNIAANPNANLVLGAPFGNESMPEGQRGGVNIAFADCQSPDAFGFVLLFTVEATLINPATTDIVFMIEKRDPPTNINFDCPLLNNCQPPTFVQHCIDRGRAYANHTSPDPSNCVEVAVEAKTWGEVKSLYN